ncbi:MAG: hypothetical protein IK133_04395 [Clostridia bacterium]|nr:hypothetical protein [Clostridia bacterium]
MKKFAALILVLVLSLTAVSALADTLIIGVPNDGTNLSRAIKLLETAGLIEVDPAAGYTPEIKDVTKYIYDIEISPVAANTLTSTLVDYAATTINGTFAIPYGLVPSKDGLIIEKQSESGDNPYINIIAARTADADNEIYKTIVAAFQTQYVAEFLLVNYNEAYFPAFPYDPDFTVEEGWTDSVAAYESSKEGKQVVRVGVVGANNLHWNAVQQVLDEQNAGIYIELVEFDAYNLPNEALNSGDIELNSFQHIAFLNNEIKNNGYDLVPIGGTLIAPLTLYSQNFDSIDAIKEAAGLLK